MKRKSSSIWMYTAMAVAVLCMASCGNSQKRKERAAERKIERQMPAGTVVESETVVVEVDSIVPDTTVINRNVATPKRTK